MVGILKNAQAAQSSPQPQAKTSLSNPALQRIEQGVEAKVPPMLKKMYLSIVVSGMKVMFDPSTAQYMQQHLQNSQDLVKTVGQDIPKLLLLVFRESGYDRSKNDNEKATFIGAAMLAGRTLMCQALDYAEKTGHVQVTPAIIDQCTTLLNTAMPAAFGITRSMMTQHMGPQAGQPQPATPGAPAVVPPQGA